jgi:hypothetical protein
LGDKIAANILAQTAALPSVPWWPLCSCKSSWSLHGIKLRTAGNDSLCCHVHFQSMDAITCRVGAEMPSSLLSFQLHCTAGWPTRWELWFFSFISPFCCLSRDQLLRTAIFKLKGNVMILLHHWNSSSYQTRLLKESLICKRFMVFVSKCFTLHGHGDADERRRGCLLQAWNDRPWVSMQCCAIHHEY